MQTTTYDIVVVGLGAMGSQTLWQLARRGHRVLGIDRFAPPHDQGSSHGKSRIIREAYFEDPRYVPLVQRAYECWAELEAASGVSLVQRTGGLMLGRADGIVVPGARRSAVEHGLPHEYLDASALRAKVPCFTVDDDTVGVWEPRAGAVAPEAAIDAALKLAAASGATIRTNEPVLDWHADATGVTVRTAQGTYHAARAVITVGAWSSSLVPSLALPLTVERQIVHWFAPIDPAPVQPNAMPVFIHEYAPGQFWYGFPDDGEGVKVGLHHQGRTVDPDLPRDAATAEEVEIVRALISQYIPAADGPLVRSAVCLYTNTPDEHFVIDRHPDHASVILASPCSGHGFKFASAIGEALADLSTDQRSRHDLSTFGLARLRGARS
jgi:sarcosine oxidase